MSHKSYHSRPRENPALATERILVQLARFSKDKQLKNNAIEAVALRPDKDIIEQIDRIVGHDKDDISEFFGVEYKNTKWKQLCSIRKKHDYDNEIQQETSPGGRKGKWYKKLNDKLSSINGESQLMNHDQDTRLKKRNNLVPPIKPDKVPDLLTKEKVNVQDSMLINSSILYCYTCWGVVSVGYECVKCKLCPIVSHRNCVIESDNFDISADNLQSEHEWTCPFCVADIHSENSHYRRKYDNQYNSYLQYISALKIQHFMRMAPKIVSFRKAKNVIIKIQHKFRIKMFWKKKEKNSNNKKVPLRIRLHKIELFIKNSNYGPPIRVKRLDPPVPPTKKIGEIMSSVYDVQFGNSMDYTPPVDEATESENSGIYNSDLLSFLSAKIIHSCGSLASDQSSIVDYLKDGHIYAPEYESTYRTLTAPPVGTVFLTITVLDKDIQIFRIDIPLKLLDKKKLTMEKLQKLGIPDDPEVYDFPELLKAFSLGTFFTNKPYILVPGCSTSCKINMIISQVTSWPKLYTAGCSSLNMAPFLLFKKSVTHSQGLAVADYDDLPIIDQGCKMQINLPIVDRKKNEKVFMCARPKNNIDHKDDKKKKDKDNDPPVYVGGAIQWTLLAFNTIDANEYGYVNTLQAPTISSAKRRFLFILIDKVITYFTPNLLTSNSIDLRLCSVTLLDDFIIKIKGPSAESWYIIDNTHKDTINWFRKMYICCKDNLAKKFNESMVTSLKSLDGQ